MRYSQVRKGEDGSVDISFYDWHYYGSLNSDDVLFQPLPGIFTSSFPNQPFARMSGLEPETPSFGD